MNPYKILGVPNGSDKVVCKKAFRRLCAKYHPDNGGDENKFHEINEAWKQIEQGLYTEVIKPKKKSFIIHQTLFTYQVA